MHVAFTVFPCAVSSSNCDMGVDQMSSPFDLESVTSSSSTSSSSHERRRRREREKARGEAVSIKKAFKSRKKIINAWIWSQPEIRENALRSIACFVPTARVLEV